jgi:hypothetical protein
VLAALVIVGSVALIIQAGGEDGASKTEARKEAA